MIALPIGSPMLAGVLPTFHGARLPLGSLTQSAAVRVGQIITGRLARRMRCREAAPVSAASSALLSEEPTATIAA